jgi:hypothetical protein
LPGTEALFRHYRPRDIVLECAVSKTKSVLEYYMYPEPALNTFDPELAESRVGTCVHEVNTIRMVETFPLAEIIDRHLPNGQDITFMSVDAEGLDLDVLASNDWQRYRPRLIVAECLNTPIDRLDSNAVVQFLDTVGYGAYAKTGNSVIFSML